MFSHFRSQDSSNRNLVFFSPKFSLVENDLHIDNSVTFVPEIRSIAVTVEAEILILEFYLTSKKRHFSCLKSATKARTYQIHHIFGASFLFEFNDCISLVLVL